MSVEVGAKIGTYPCGATTGAHPHGEHRCTLTKDVYYPEPKSLGGWVEYRHNGPHVCACGAKWDTPT